MYAATEVSNRTYINNIVSSYHHWSYPTRGVGRVSPRHPNHRDHALMTACTDYIPECISGHSYALAATAANYGAAASSSDSTFPPLVFAAILTLAAGTLKFYLAASSSAFAFLLFGVVEHTFDDEEQIK